MKYTRNHTVLYMVAILFIAGLLSGCKQVPTQPATLPPHHGSTIPTMPTDRLPTTSPIATFAGRTALQTSTGVIPQPTVAETLSFDVENKMFKTAYITCFCYQRKRDFGHWRWYKSPIYQIDPNQTVTVSIDASNDEQDQKSVFGYLGVFNDEATAQEATYELVDDRYLLDLDLVWKLKNQKVTLEVDTYGVHGEYLEYDFIDKKGEKKSPNSLDFFVENQSGAPVIVVGFIYEKKAKSKWIDWLNEKDDMSVWRFDKTPLLKLGPKEIGTIKVPPVTSTRDINYLRGYLAVFDVDEEDKAQQATLELLAPNNKFSIGEIFRLKNKKIIIDVQKYGLTQDFVEFTVKPIKHIDFTKIRHVTT